jgi:glycosyltransferase involved in cell wall biosynthesis
VIELPGNIITESMIRTMDNPERIVITQIEDRDVFTKFPDKIVALADGWTAGPVAAVLRGGVNAKAVLELLSECGVKEVVIYHLEEKVNDIEDIFLSTVVSEAHRLFDQVSIFWRHEASIFELIKNIGGDFAMLFFGAPLARSEVEPFYRKIKTVFPGKVAFVRGPMAEIELSGGDEIFKWVRERTYNASDFSIPSLLRNRKKQQDLRVDVILPSLNEEKTIAKVIETALEVKETGIIDEVILIDSNSSDNTVEIAREYGIPIYLHPEIRPDLGRYHGKGEAMFKSGLVSQADILAWVDTDIENITPSFFYGLLGPMLTDPQIKFVKGYFSRPVRVEATGVELGGGRVTEILARPWLNIHMPKLSGFIQPLAGTVAIYRDLFQSMRVPTNYGVEIAMLIQAVEANGLWSTCQVNLGEVIHRSKDVQGLSEMSYQILQVLDAMTADLPIQNSSLRRVLTAQGHFELSIKRFHTNWRSFEGIVAG